MPETAPTLDEGGITSLFDSEFNEINITVDSFVMLVDTDCNPPAPSVVRLGLGALSLLLR